MSHLDPPLGFDDDPEHLRTEPEFPDLETEMARIVRPQFENYKQRVLADLQSHPDQASIRGLIDRIAASQSIEDLRAIIQSGSHPQAMNASYNAWLSAHTAANRGRNRPRREDTSSNPLPPMVRGQNAFGLNLDER